MRYFDSKRLKSLFLLVVLAVAPLASADPRLDGLFNETFQSLYESNRCGQNIMNFVREADARGINLDNGSLLEITNAGGTELDAIWGLYARGEGIDRWMFHVVFEHDGKIYDFDYTDAARPTATPEYFHRMFIDLAARRPSAGYLPNPLTDYRVRRIPARTYVAYVNGGPSPGRNEFTPVPLNVFLGIR